MLHWLSLAFAGDPDLAHPPEQEAAHESEQKAAPEDHAWQRLVKRSQRLTARTQEAEARWSTCSGSEPEGKKARRLARAERGLINSRYRQSCVLRQLDAWDAPEGDVRVLYATNRRRSAQGFLARDADRLEYGVATVYIPPRHPLGALERELTVKAIEPMSQEAFLVAVEAALSSAGPRAELLVYVHGYNNSFEYAARRTAQITHDLGVPMVPVLFSWPSHGGEWFSSAKYTYDENAAARSSTLLADVLDELMTGTSGVPVNVLAHSMGSRVISDALMDLDRRDALHRPLHDLVLAAPDLDAAVYGRRYLDLSLEAARRVTVYCASDDRALKLSRTVHGGYDRLGTCRPDTISALERPGLDIVDASRLYVDMLDHDKVADSPRLLRDLASVLRGVEADSPERSLVNRDTHFELPP